MTQQDAAAGPLLPSTTAASASEAGAAAAPAVAIEDIVLQYIVLRRDLWGEMGWPLGSVVAQGAHAATAALWLSREEAVTQAYCAPENIDHMHKVVLEVKGEAQLRGLSEKLGAAGVPHKLWIEQPEDYATCLATAPLPKSRVQPHVKKLKLCKG
eukprot:scaffold15.g4306.t1